MKELKSIVCSLELARELRENGYPQESLFKWCEWDKTDEFYDNEKNRVFSQEQWENYATDYNPPNSVFYSAPTAAELLNELPKHTKTGKGNFIYASTDLDGFIDTNGRKHSGTASETGDTHSDALARLWLYLKKEGLL